MEGNRYPSAVLSLVTTKIKAFHFPAAIPSPTILHSMSAAVLAPYPYDRPLVVSSPNLTNSLKDTKEGASQELPDGEHVNPEADAEAVHTNAEFPDGGWRAWLIVFGVCLFESYVVLNFMFYIRRCAMHSARMSRLHLCLMMHKPYLGSSWCRIPHRAAPRARFYHHIDIVNRTAI